MKPFTLALATVVALSSLAFADSASVQQRGGHEAHEEFREHMLERMKDRLGLTDAQAQKMTTTFQSFKPRREALHQQMKVTMDSLRSAADGDSAALQQLDATEQKLVDLRSQQAQLHRDVRAAVSQGLSPQQRAKLDLFLAHRAAGMRGRFGGHRHGN